MITKLTNRCLQQWAFICLLLLLWVVGIGAFHSHATMQDTALEHCDLCIMGQQLQHTSQPTAQPLLLNAEISFLVSINKISFFSTTIINNNLSRAPPAFL